MWRLLLLIALGIVRAGDLPRIFSAATRLWLLPS